MSGWTSHNGLAVALPLDNIDTDQLIPARFMSRPRSQGYGDLLLHDVRQQADGTPDPAFILHRFPTASIVVAGNNFGSGSSREAAVYALLDAGIKVVIAPGFGDIFTANSANNGLLTACVAADKHRELIACLEHEALSASVDLQQRKITLLTCHVSFDIDDVLLQKIVHGWDDIDLTLQHRSQIDAYSEQLKSNASWRWPA